VNDTERDEPNRDLSTWTIEDLEAHAGAQRGQEMERVRVVAQTHAYRPGEPPQVRLRWAKLSLNANERLHSDDPWDRARMRAHNFALRTWIIEHLGPDADPDWDPETLAADTLAALTLDPDQARARSGGWRNLPIEQISELRQHKNLTAHLDRLIGHLQVGPVRDRLIAWMAIRPHLP
jgi:hypothetical protein